MPRRNEQLSLHQEKLSYVLMKDQPNGVKSLKEGGQSGDVKLAVGMYAEKTEYLPSDYGGLDVRTASSKISREQ